MCEYLEQALSLNIRKIIHIDMDCFYAQVEERENPKLKGKPIAVGGYSNRRGVLCTSNYIARQYGVRAALPTQMALQKCPDLIVVPPNFELYKEISQKIKIIFSEYTDLIEPLSLDEAYLDVTHNQNCHNSATLLARDIRQKIWQEENLTASAGISSNKFLAKIASDWKKPNGQFTIPPEDISQFVLSLDIKKIFGVGPVMAKKLNDMSIYQCSDLQDFSLTQCIQKFGKMGAMLYERSRGIDTREVISHRERKSLSVEETYEHDLANLDACLQHIPDLIRKLTQRLTKANNQNKIYKLFVKIKFFDFSQTTVEHINSIINQSAYESLLKEGFARGNKAVRLLGLGVRFKEKKENDFEQLSLL